MFAKEVGRENITIATKFWPKIDPKKKAHE